MSVMNAIDRLTSGGLLPVHRKSELMFWLGCSKGTIYELARRHSHLAVRLGRLLRVRRAARATRAGRNGSER